MHGTMARVAGFMVAKLGRTPARRRASWSRLSIEERDLGINRLCHLASELGEYGTALQTADRVAAADALADLVYLCAGAALDLGIPLPEVLEEVHRANMTKDPLTAAGTGGKGPNYTPPDVAKVLDDCYGPTPPVDAS